MERKEFKMGTRNHKQFYGECPLCEKQITAHTAEELSHNMHLHINSHNKGDKK